MYLIFERNRFTTENVNYTFLIKEGRKAMLLILKNVNKLSECLTS